jgi:hypothetical protein
LRSDTITDGGYCFQDFLAGRRKHRRVKHRSLAVKRDRLDPLIFWQCLLIEAKQI